MATRLESMQIGDQMVWVEVEDLPPAPGKTRKTSATADGGALGDLGHTDLAGPLKSILASVHEGVRAIAPGEVTVEVSFGLKGEVGFFVARSEGSASLKVTARWKFDTGAAKAPG